MLRQLLVTAVVLVLFGLELATEALTLAVGRLASGVSAIRHGIEFHVPTGRFVAGVFALVVGFGSGAVALWMSKASSTLAVVAGRCPSCGDETQRVKRRKRHRLLSKLMGERLARHVCGSCGWQGLSIRY